MQNDTPKGLGGVYGGGSGGEKETNAHKYHSWLGPALVVEKKHHVKIQLQTQTNRSRGSKREANISIVHDSKKNNGSGGVEVGGGKTINTTQSDRFKCRKGKVVE